jgi:hypothetical protein
VWWLTPAIVAMGLCATTSIPVGVWILSTSRWPSWLRGALKWPLGDRLSPQVVRLQGWAYVLVGASSLVMMGLLLALPALLEHHAGRLIVLAVAAIGLVLVTTGTVPYVRSVRISRA